jgi:hypothetical protein
LKNERRLHLIVIRVGGPRRRDQSRLCMSKPCADCLRNLQENYVNCIDKVYYSTSDGGMACEQLADMSTQHVSRGNR